MRWIGQAETALNMMIDRPMKRFAHGSLLAEKQGIQWLIADSTMELYQSKPMVLHAAYRIDRGLDFRSEVSMAKHFVANALNRIVDRAIQVHGAARLLHGHAPGAHDDAGAVGPLRRRSRRGAPDADRAARARGVRQGRERPGSRGGPAALGSAVCSRDGGYAMPEIEPLDATFGAIVRGVELRSIDDATFRDLHARWLEYALLIFPDQFLTREEQTAFARRFGELEFETAPISNLRRDGTVRTDPEDDVIKVLKGNMGWHCDSTYMPVQAKGAVFSAEVVPSRGGETGWADMRAAYDVLDDETRRKVHGRSAYHSLWYSQAKLGHRPKKGSEYSGYGFHDGEPSLRPLVKIHPETGRPSLVIGRHAYGIPGMEPDESERFLTRLVEDACRPPRIYHHAWRPGEACVWDNRCLLHQARPWDMNEPRVMWHTRLAGDRASELAINLEPAASGRSPGRSRRASPPG
jgi:alpha-ketoglutarate-dependent taurine dioxygenase